MAVDPTTATDPTAGQATAPAGAQPAKGADFLLHLIDVINPLQHIPIVSTIYRKITGDEIAPAARLLGGGLFAGPLGLAAAAAGIVTEATTGRDLGGHTLALFDRQPAGDPILAAAGQPEPEKNAPTPAVQAAAEAAATPPEPIPAGFLASALTEQSPTEPGPAAAGDTLTASALAAQNDLAATILDALDKYQTMARERNGLSAEDKPDEPD